MTKLVRYLILTHRYLGIAISLVFIVWFASGIVMMYAGGMPSLTAQERLHRLPPLDLANVKLTPAEAAERAGGRNARTPTLTSVMGRPAYRFQGGRGPGFGGGPGASGGAAPTIFADTGDALQNITVEQARTVASRFVSQPENLVEFVRTLDKPDQWTLMSRGREVSLHKFRVNDAAATELYVSPNSAEVTQLTTRKTRTLAWMGTIPHWLYFATLRVNQPVWYKTVVWLSSLGCVLAVLGLILGFTQFRKSTPFRLKSSVLYRGLMYWHYILGALFGVFALTWVFSGLVSMDPWAWTNARGLEIRRDVFSGGGPPQLPRFGAMDPAVFAALAPGRTIKEIGFTRIQDDNYYSIRATAATAPNEDKTGRGHRIYDVSERSERSAIVVNASTLELRRDDAASVDFLLAKLKEAAPNVPIVDAQLISEYDSYYYSRNGESPLPVLRVKFGDPAQTWFYIDPQRSQILRQVHHSSRLKRWLYSGLHNLDFALWYSKRPLWDIGMIVLLLGGLALSCTGFYQGIKRLRRNIERHVVPH